MHCLLWQKKVLWIPSMPLKERILSFQPLWDQPRNTNAALCICLKSKHRSILAGLCRVCQRRTKANYLWLISVSPRMYNSPCDVSLLLNENAIPLISQVQINLLLREDWPSVSTSSTLFPKIPFFCRSTEWNSDWFTSCWTGTGGVGCVRVPEWSIGKG